jgi:hypothetical protein
MWMSPEKKAAIKKASDEMDASMVGRTFRKGGFGGAISSVVKTVTSPAAVLTGAVTSVVKNPVNVLKVANPITMAAAVAPKSISDKINVLTPAGVPNIQDKKLKKTAMIGYGTALAVAGGVALATYGSTAAITGAAGKAGTAASLASKVKGAFPGANAAEGQDFQNAAYYPDGTAVAGPADPQMFIYIGIGIVLLLLLRK